ncbi:MAG: AAA family ATPase [Desulfobacteraceae bacterium]|nr:AAA family ATPase [Desulfobacteraceae bacterium]
MIIIPGYNILDKIYESDNSLVYRSDRKKDGLPVILKILKKDYYTPHEPARYEQEYKITAGLDIEGVIKTYGIEKYQNKPVIVSEDFGAESLKALSDSKEFTIGEFLKIAIQLAEILGKIHAANVTHKNINPSNIVINPNTDQLKIIDFGISTLLPHENPAIKNPNDLEGTLAYMSPEQTGRMNRSLDYRTDFYSLGVTFYELLARRLPFETSDVLELVYCHIARIPTPLCKLNDGIPKMISDIVMKLMTKTAEDRYQSAFGLKADLGECLDRLNSLHVIGDFETGKNDFSGRLHIPEKLYGREQEKTTLVKAFERVCPGRTELMLVAGYSGVGKSALVKEIQKPITEKRGGFISGKFEQFQMNIPYYAFIQAFKEFVGLILAEKEEELALWKEKILNTVGNIGKVLTDIIPKLELIIGKQPDIPDLGSAETLNRFNYVFENFVRAVSQENHPLVIVLDDLQWADSASLDLLKVLAGDPDSRCLLLIGAYRDNEVDSSHPFAGTLEEMRDNAIISAITVQNLSFENVFDLISDALQNPGIAGELAGPVWEKTGGNAFFVRQFLKSCYEEDMLRFDFKKKSWQMDLSAIQKTDMTDNVAELMVNRIEKILGPRDIIKQAACIGNRFDLETLAIISEKSEKETFRELQHSLVEYLIIETGNSDSDDPIRNFKFSHDHIHQAVYSLIPESEKEAIHLEIGKLLLKKISGKQQDERIFDIVNQLNTGRKLIDNADDLVRLARLNLKAGRKAKASAAYQPALNYFSFGLALLPENSWENYHKLTFALHRERYECEYLAGDFKEAEKLFDIIMTYAESKLEKVEIYNICIVQYTMMSKYDEAYLKGLSALKLFGMGIPGNINDVLTSVERELADTYHFLGKRKIEDFIHLPMMIDQEKKESIKLLMNIATVLYFGMPDLFGLIASRMVSTARKYGNTREMPFGYSSFGLFLSARGDYKSGYEFGKAGIKLSDEYGDNTQKCRANLFFSLFINHWRMHVNSSLFFAQQGFHYGLESGELQYSGYSAFSLSVAVFLRGDELGSVLAEFEKAAYFADKTKNGFVLNACIVYRQFILNLMGRTTDKSSFDHPYFNESGFLENTKDWAPLSIFHVFKLQSFYMYEKYTQALEMALKTEELLNHIACGFPIANYNFYYSLTISALYLTNKKKQKQYRKKLETNQKQMKIWADNCPENFLHKYLLVQAEIARIKGRCPEAAELYRNAAEEAGKNEFIYDEALANELEAKLRLAQGEDNNAAIPMAGAHNCYKRWGALGKVKDIEEKYPQLLAERSVKQSIRGIQAKNISFLTGGANMDLVSLMKASQSISGEIHLDRLLADLMQIVMESAGAQTAAFILNKKGELLIEADAVSYENVNVLQSVPVKTATSLSQSVIFYVFRTEKLVVLNDAANKGQFVNDPYIRENKTKSLLCIPLFSKKKLIGIIYLENNLATGTFTSERTEVLQLLSSQAAISVENAMLYTGIESKVRERTSQLNRTLSEVKQNIRDIRDLKQKVEGEKEQFQRLTEATFEGILIYENGRVIETNKPAQDMFGMQRFELTGKNPTDLISAEEPGSLENMDIEAPYESRGIRKDGSRFPIEVQTKPINWYGKSVRVAAIRNITWRKKIEKENIALKHTLKGRYKLGDIIGKSERMQDVYEQIAGAAGVDFNVIIYGESGTGKELAARTVHRLSSRNNKPFVPVNCGAVQETLFESEFFGYCKGAFTGANRDNPGFLDSAFGGTLFLDEVGELNHAMQVKLLRVLQDAEYTPLGSNTRKKADVRIIAATNRDLKTEVKKGRIREDFFYRIHVIDLEMPPLRFRKEDIPMMIDFFLEQYGRERSAIPENIVKAMYRYDWPGNVRELQNKVQVFLATKRLELGDTHLPDIPENEESAELNVENGELSQTLERYEKQIISRALKNNSGSREKTAAQLKITTRTLHRKIKKFDLS